MSDSETPKDPRKGRILLGTVLLGIFIVFGYVMLCPTDCF